MLATVAALVGIGPKDEIEGMIAAQLIATHNAAMECYRRAMLGEQTFEGRRGSPKSASSMDGGISVLEESHCCTPPGNAWNQGSAVPIPVSCAIRPMKQRTYRKSYRCCDRRLAHAGARVATSNSISHATNTIDVAEVPAASTGELALMASPGACLRAQE